MPQCSLKIPIGIDVLTAAKQRIEWAFDNIPKIYVSFSGGKDSSVMLHLVAEEARKRGKKIGCLFIDWEAQYKLTIDHVCEMFELYQDVIIPYWVALPLKTINAVSQYEPEWIAWDPDKTDLWVRSPPDIAITDEKYFPFYTHAMTFEEFAPAFGHWYSAGKLTACLVGIRSDESLHRFRTVAMGKKQTLDGKCYTTWHGEALYNVYPIYDWKTSDIWKYHGKTGKPYNKLYDRMHQAGVSLHKMRICEPYGSEQRQGLWLFHVIEPESWNKIVSRVSGANFGAIYANERGNVLGINQITLPDGQTWKDFAMLLLESMPKTTREHYKNKIAVYIRWYQIRGYPDGLPDTQEEDCGASDNHPSWKRICKIILRNDFWCKGLSFSPTKTAAYEKYQKLMKRRRQQWNLMI